MSPAFSIWLALALTACAAVSAADAPTTPPIAPFECSGQVCGFNVLAASLVTAPCEGRSLLVAYSQTNGSALVQCADPARTSDNLVYVFDRSSSGGPVYELEGARYVTAAFLLQAATEGVPDRFGAVPLCRVAGAAVSGELTLLIKEPNSGNSSPYCYRLYRVAHSAGRVAVVVEGATAPAPAANGRVRWAKLTARLLPYMNNAVSPVASAAKIGVAKARLYTRPEASATTRMYLTRGDAVTLLAADSGTGWSRVRYTGKSGKPIDRWIRTAQLTQ